MVLNSTPSRLVNRELVRILPFGICDMFSVLFTTFVSSFIVSLISTAVLNTMTPKLSDYLTPF